MFRIFLCAIICSFLTLHAQTTSSSSSSSTPSIAPIMPPKADIAPPPTKQPPRQQFFQGQRAPLPHSAHEIFSAPGVATFQNGVWAGREDLLNIPKEIGVYVEVNAPPTLSVVVSEDAIRSDVSRLLASASLKPRPALMLHKGTPLPFLHVLVLAMPIERGLSVYCAVRLFEEAKINRVQLKPGIIWQTITWEKQELLLLPSEMFQSEVLKVVNRLVNAFVERYHKDER